MIQAKRLGDEVVDARVEFFFFEAIHCKAFQKGNRAISFIFFPHSVQHIIECGIKKGSFDECLW